MANLVVTTSANSIVVAFNDYSGAIGATKRSFSPQNMTEVSLMTDEVRVYMDVTHDLWRLTYDSSYSGNEKFIVDSVDGVAPTSESDLFDKITALR